MPETHMGGSREDFPETVWSSVINNPDSPDRREKLNRLLSRYWRPVYKYVRAAWKKSIEDAKDLTQEFFLGIMDGGIFERYDAEKGRFRYFLKGEVWTSTGTYCLPGITRANVIRLCRENDIPVFEKDFQVDAVHSADEAFVTSATSLVMPVVGIDDAVLGDGRPGPLTTRLRQIYIDHIRTG